MSDPEQVLVVRVRRLEHALGSLISWASQSANAPISLREGRQLLGILEGVDVVEARYPCGTTAVGDKDLPSACPAHGVDCFRDELTQKLQDTFANPTGAVRMVARFEAALRSSLPHGCDPPTEQFMIDALAARDAFWQEQLATLRAERDAAQQALAAFQAQRSTEDGGTTETPEVVEELRETRDELDAAQQQIAEKDALLTARQETIASMGRIMADRAQQIATLTEQLREARELYEANHG